MLHRLVKLVWDVRPREAVGPFAIGDDVRTVRRAITNDDDARIRTRTKFYTDGIPDDVPDELPVIVSYHVRDGRMRVRDIEVWPSNQDVDIDVRLEGISLFDDDVAAAKAKLASMDSSLDERVGAVWSKRWGVGIGPRGQVFVCADWPRTAYEPPLERLAPVDPGPWIVEPLTTVGPVRFGATITETRLALGPCLDTTDALLTDNCASLFSELGTDLDVPSDVLASRNATIHYRVEAERVIADAVELRVPNAHTRPLDVRVHGRPLVGPSAEETMTWLRTVDPNVEQVGTAWWSPAYAIAVWRDIWHEHEVRALIAGPAYRERLTARVPKPRRSLESFFDST
jgi:hypothetical protein